VPGRERLCEIPELLEDVPLLVGRLKGELKQVSDRVEIVVIVHEQHHRIESVACIFVVVDELRGIPVRFVVVAPALVVGVVIWYNVHSFPCPKVVHLVIFCRPRVVILVVVIRHENVGGGESELVSDPLPQLPETSMFVHLVVQRTYDTTTSSAGVQLISYVHFDKDVVLRVFGYTPCGLYLVRECPHSPHKHAELTKGCMLRSPNASGPANSVDKEFMTIADLAYSGRIVTRGCNLKSAARTRASISVDTTFVWKGCNCSMGAILSQHAQ